MRLSIAIRLGSLAIQNPQAGDTRYCAIGMGLECIGKRNMGRDGGNFDAKNYVSLGKEWPWTYLRLRDGNSDNQYWLRIATSFDTQVMEENNMTLEQLCDQVRVWEDELAAKGINVEQVSMAVELTEPASQAAEHTEKELVVEAK